MISIVFISMIMNFGIGTLDMLVKRASNVPRSVEFVPYFFLTLVFSTCHLISAE